MSVAYRPRYLLRGSPVLLAGYRGPALLGPSADGPTGREVFVADTGSRGAVVCASWVGHGGAAAYEDLALDTRRREARWHVAVLLAESLPAVTGGARVAVATAVIRRGLFGPVAELAGTTVDGRDFGAPLPEPPGLALDEPATLPDGSLAVAAIVLRHACEVRWPETRL